MAQAAIDAEALLLIETFFRRNSNALAAIAAQDDFTQLQSRPNLYHLAAAANWAAAVQQLVATGVAVACAELRQS
jgi:hypothetical protein